MTRKPLPKAIVRPLTNFRDTAANIALDEEAPAPAAAAFNKFDTAAAEPPLAISAQPAANDPMPTAEAEALAAQQRALAAKRLALAKKIVQRHRLYAAFGGLSPLPVVNIAGVTAMILRMVRQLSTLYQIPFHRDRTRAMIISLMGGAVPTGLGAATASTLAFVVPGGAFVGLGVSAVTAAALTRGIGLVFIESFEGGAG